MLSRALLDKPVGIIAAVFTIGACLAFLAVLRSHFWLSAVGEPRGRPAARQAGETLTRRNLKNWSCRGIQLGKLKNEVSKLWPVLRFCNIARQLVPSSQKLAVSVPEVQDLLTSSAELGASMKSEWAKKRNWKARRCAIRIELEWLTSFRWSSRPDRRESAPVPIARVTA